MKNFILLDTSSSDMKIAFSLDGINGNKTYKNDTNHLENIVTAIDEIFQETKCDKKKLDLISACCGPGSFTGIRIGIATVQAIGFGGNIKTSGFSIFDIYSFLMRDFKDSIIVPLIDGKKNQFYCKFINSNDENYYDLKVGEIIAYLKENCIKNGKKNIIFAGKDFRKIEEEIKRNDIVYQYKYENDYLASELVEFGKFCIENQIFYELEPIYIRKSDAEINLLKKKNLK